ncbi:unnamed protein product [Boreogadus saida]
MFGPHTTLHCPTGTHNATSAIKRLTLPTGYHTRNLPARENWHVARLPLKRFTGRIRPDNGKRARDGPKKGPPPVTSTADDHKPRNGASPWKRPSTRDASADLYPREDGGEGEQRHQPTAEQVGTSEEDDVQSKTLGRTGSRATKCDTQRRVHVGQMTDHATRRRPRSGGETWRNRHTGKHMTSGAEEHTREMSRIGEP